MRLMFLLFTALIISCGGLEHRELPQQNPDVEECGFLPASLSDEDFIVKSDSTIIELGMDYRELSTDEKIKYIRYADEQLAYNTIVYDNFIISFDKEIFRIALTTPVFETSRGIRTGDDISYVLERHGRADRFSKDEPACDDEVESYSYYYNGMMMIYYIDRDGKITRILLECI